MRHLPTLLILITALVSGQSEACTASAITVTPATSNRSATQGSAIVYSFVSISIDCNAGETYSISPTSSTFSGAIGTSGFNAIASFCKNSICSLPLWTNAITGTAATTGTTNVNVFLTVYGQGSSNTFKGTGTYSIPMSLTITSSGGSPLTYSHTETGTVTGTCSANAATAAFGVVPYGVANPIQSVSVTFTCTINMPYTISQTTVASINIGANSTNKAWLYSDAAGMIPIQTTPIVGNGTGASQAQTIYVGLSGAASRTTAITGYGTISGAVQYVISY